MIEIIPNWHPLLVHFTLGLLTTSALFYLGAALLSKRHAWKHQWLNMANWSLWSGCLFAIATAITGWLAYNSVAHDSASHAAMTLHKNWALPTAGTFLLLGLWAVILARKGRYPGIIFLIFSTIAAGLILVTGWLGAEGVYRYGLGVKALPKVEAGADGHNHSHGSHSDGTNMNEAVDKAHQHPAAETEQPINPDEHPHDHDSIQNKKEKDNHHPVIKSVQPLKQDRHQHQHQHGKAEISSEDTNNAAEQPQKMNPENIKGHHFHSSDNAQLIMNPPAQEKNMAETTLTPSELSSLNIIEKQNKEVQNHEHEH